MHHILVEFQWQSCPCPKYLDFRQWRRFWRTSGDSQTTRFRYAKLRICFEILLAFLTYFFNLKRFWLSHRLETENIRQSSVVPRIATVSLVLWKTGNINDPLGQTYSQASSDHYIPFKFVWFERFWKVGTDGRTDTTYENSDHYTGCDCWLAVWINRM